MNPWIENDWFCPNSVPCADVYGHFYIFTRINDLHHPSSKKRWLLKFTFKRICEAFWLCISHNNNKDRGRAEQHAPRVTWYRADQSQRSFWSQQWQKVACWLSDFSLRVSWFFSDFRSFSGFLGALLILLVTFCHFASSLRHVWKIFSPSGDFRNFLWYSCFLCGIAQPFQIDSEIPFEDLTNLCYIFAVEWSFCNSERKGKIFNFRCCVQSWA